MFAPVRKHAGAVTGKAGREDGRQLIGLSASDGVAVNADPVEIEEEDTSAANRHAPMFASDIRR